MYSRSFTPTDPKRYGDIPVQSFEDSFSADAFLKQDAANRVQHEPRSESESEKPNASEESPAQSGGKPHRALHPDDLILLGLFILFLNETPKNGDRLLPILLAVLLLS